jgi:hypothetical protein
MAVSRDLGTVAEAIGALLEAATSLGLKAVYYGDTELKPDYPAAVVQSVSLKRGIKGTHKFEIVMEHELILTVFKMGDPKGREEDIHELVEGVTAVFDADRSLSGNVIFAMISGVDMVDVALGSVMVRGVTMTIESLSEEVF